MTRKSKQHDNIIIIESSDLHFSPENDTIYNLFTIKYKESSDSWNRQVSISNLFLKSSIIDHYTIIQKVLVVPQISGGNIYSFQSLNLLASSGYISDSLRIHPVNHSQQDNMFIIYELEGVTINIGDVVFVVDDHLFGETNKYKLRNYLCGWHKISSSNINNVKYIAIYIDFNQDTGNTIENVNYKYKIYKADEDKVYDLESIIGNNYTSLGYGSINNPLILTKSNLSVVKYEINNINIYDLLLTYL